MYPSSSVKKSERGLNMIRYPADDPLTKQPVAVGPSSAHNINYMPVPSGHFSCAPGLEYLTMIEQILVHRQVGRLEVLNQFYSNKRYTIRNSMGQVMYHAADVTDCCDELCYGRSMALELSIVDYRGVEVIHLGRELNCTNGCFPCCLRRVDVSAPPGTLLGCIEENWTCRAPGYFVKDQTRKTVFKIEGTPCICCADAEFKVLSTDGRVIGNISKQGSELVKEVFTDANYFGITFPLDLSVDHKCLLLGALFLMDFIFYGRY